MVSAWFPFLRMGMYVVGLKEDGNLGFDGFCFRQGGEGDVEINLGLSR